MNGLLHRLASRAIGVSLPIRSDASLPFVKHTPLREEAVDAAVAAARPDTSEVSAKEQAAPPAHAGRPAELLPPTENLRSHPATAAQAVEAVRNDLRPAPMHDSPRDSSRVAHPVPLADSSRGRAAAPAAVDERAAPLKPLLTRPADSPAPRSSAREESRAPARLMPAESRSNAAPTRPGREPATYARSAPAVAPTEVHLHIGRIEVAATTPAPTPRRRPAPVSTAVPLDAYLSRRRK